MNGPLPDGRGSDRSGDHEQNRDREGAAEQNRDCEGVAKGQARPEPLADARGSVRMLDFHKQLSAALQRQTDTTDRQIDRLVYELYGLTDEEIRNVEEVTR